LKRSNILVIIPCYNEEPNIRRVIERLQSACPTVDYLVINDCSTDRSAEILQQNGYSYVCLPVNLGIGGGVQTGYRYARDNGYEIAVQMDGDGQHDPAYLERVIAPVQAGKLDMCIGSRFLEKEGFQSSPLRRFGINFLSGMIYLLSGTRVRDVTSGFRATGPAMTAFFAEHYAADYPEPEAILAATLRGFAVGEVPVVMEERMGGISSIRSFKSVYFMIKVSLSLLVDRISIRRRKDGGKK
jgi:glycosyltransferase involved in cell wall biosynthesis